MDLTDLQQAVNTWHELHFPTVDTTRIVLKAVEETGELAKARERRMAGKPDAIPKEQNAVGDILFTLAALCAREGWSLDEIVQVTIDEVFGRSHERITG